MNILTSYTFYNFFCKEVHTIIITKDKECYIRNNKGLNYIGFVHGDPFEAISNVRNEVKELIFEKEINYFEAS